MNPTLQSRYSLNSIVDSLLVVFIKYLQNQSLFTRKYQVNRITQFQYVDYGFETIDDLMSIFTNKNIKIDMLQYKYCEMCH